jgi:glutamate-1-semialdehyde 2,1-aminomutase
MAGLTMLQTLNNDLFFDRLAEKTAYLHKGIEAALKANNVVHTINRGSMISVHFDATPVIDFKSAANGDNDTFKNSFMDCCKKEFILRHP